MKVTIREEAADDLVDIFEWNAKDDPAAALDVIVRIRARIERLTTPGLSHMGRFGMIDGTRELVEAPYIVVYQINERHNEIVVIAVFHSRRDRNLA